MFFDRWFIISTAIIYDLIQIVDSVYYYYWKCQLGSREWRCSSSQTCGNTYGSCIDGSSKPLEKHVVIIIIVVIVICTIIFGVCVCYCRKKQNLARAQWLQQRQAMFTQNQAQCIYYITSDPSYAVQPPIQEAPPPSYEQIVSKTNEN